MPRTRTALLTLALLGLAAGAAAGPEGYYVSVDDSTDARRALIEIVRADDGTLEGYARGSFIPGEDVTQPCAKCKDELEGQPLLGLRILRELEPSTKSPLEFKSGCITDPDNGQTYKSKVEFADDYSAVKVRGYIGTPALGRSQVWTRATDNDIAAANAIGAAFGVPAIAPSQGEAN